MKILKKTRIGVSNSQETQNTEKVTDSFYTEIVI